MNLLRAGVIGMGFIGPVHVEAVRRTGMGNITAISDKDFQKTKELAHALDIEKVYEDYHDMIKDPDIDVIHVCVPNHMHYEIVKEALAAGKHVVCDKPLAMEASEGEELVKLARESGLVCGIHLNIRNYPLLQHVRSMIANGDLGTIFAVNGSYQQDWLFKQTDYSWRLEKQFSGKSRAIADIGSHWFDTVETVTGLRVTEVLADFATFYPVRKKPLKDVATYSGKVLEASDYEDIAIDTEDYATVLLHFSNGAHGSFTANQVAAGRKNRIYFEIYGSKSAIAYDSEIPNLLWIGHRDTANELVMKDPSLVNPDVRDYISYPGGHAEGWADATKHIMIRIYQDILRKPENRKYDYPLFEDGWRELTLCDAIFESSQSGSWTTVPEVG